ncbi:Putative addiction module component [Stieleria maiorica]|uniref:Addiction module component n=1 Tax=Stieleria maiorica TaxID=2795974 RepID=A0A5B9MR31_9BACT|nr:MULTISPECIES: addiction module protein [Pirellulaceae]QEG02711.1 Putative addiction module component [Stieleria maiorica]
MEPHQLTEAALSLPEPQRIELAASLIYSLEPTPDPNADAAWADEINRRLISIDEGKVSLLPSEDVLAEMKQRRNG